MLIMEVKYLKDDKNEAEIEMDNLTIVEVVRAYLAKDSAVEFVAWKRTHPTKRPILYIRTKGKTARKALEEACALIEKDGDKIVDAFKKAK